MISISLCMIVKNEEKNLARCLNSLEGIMDEIIIVDTGSTDATKQVASRYTDKIYDFAWVDDFSAARNFAFSLASMDYIYSADADEVLLEKDRKDFEILKEVLLPEIEIVQMKYANQLSQGTVYNYDTEYRPKLFKRLRNFQWIDAIHETVRLDPIVYDSEVTITHMPDEPHGGRDLDYFRKLVLKGERLSSRLHHMYAMELFLSGSDEDFIGSGEFFKNSALDPTRSIDEIMEACVVAAKVCYLKKDEAGLLKYATRVVASEGCSEIGVILGRFFEDRGDVNEAVMWYHAAAYTSEPILRQASKTRDPIEALERLGVYSKG